MADNDVPRWLLLVHQLPSEPSNLRVKTWRRLQSVGAVLVKNSVYALPNSTETREDLEWIRSEIVNLGGEAVIFAADAVDDLTADEVVEAFASARRGDWRELLERATAVLARSRAETEDVEKAGKRLERELKTLRNRATQIDKIDFFSAPGRDETLEAIERVAAAVLSETTEAAQSDSTLRIRDYRGRRWLTRPRPGVDRMASGWLIRRFIDPEAEFVFAERIPADGDSVPFDMFGVEFGHHGELCTFETLLGKFGLTDPALTRVARIVHDLDLRSVAAGDAETATIGRLVDGLREAFDEDPVLLERGMSLFEALHRSFRRDVARA